MTPPLRFVVVSDTGGLAPWQSAAVDTLARTGLAVVAEPVPASASISTLHAALSDADVCVNFASRPLPQEMLALPRFGVWVFDFGAPRAPHARPIGFEELRRGASVVQAALVRLTGEFTGVVLHEGAFPTKPHSLAWTRSTALRGVAPWLAKGARDLLAGASPEGEERRSLGPPSAPGPLAKAVLAGRLACRFARAQVTGIASGAKWNVGVVPCPIEQIPDGPLTGVRWFPEPERGVFLADPFLWDGERPVVILEHLRQTKGLGTLATYSVDGQPLDLPVPIMSGHLSYPYTFTHNGRTYCVPESAQSRVARLFRFDAEAGSWVKEADLIEGRRLLDATVFPHDGRWWLFATDAELGGTWSLHAWWADDVLGPWQEHSANPVKTDVRAARPAGTPFMRDGRLIRPAQDCSGSYGSAVVLNEVLELSPTRFTEREAGRVEPGEPYPAGLHTLSAAGAVTLVDGKRSELSWGHARREIQARLSRLWRKQR